MNGRPAAACEQYGATDTLSVCNPRRPACHKGLPDVKNIELLRGVDRVEISQSLQEVPLANEDLRAVKRLMLCEKKPDERGIPAKGVLKNNPCEKLGAVLTPKA